MAKLTEQDILNYDGDDYMNADHLEFFKDRLLQMQQELLSNANATTSHLQEQEATPDPADRATLEEEYALELRTRDRERKLLLKIQQHDVSPGSVARPAPPNGRGRRARRAGWPT